MQKLELNGKLSHMSVNCGTIPMVNTPQLSHYQFPVKINSLLLKRDTNKQHM